MTKCIFCGETLADNTQICPWCGRRQPEGQKMSATVRESQETGWRCKKCNQFNPATAIFCPQCGTKREQEPAQEHAGSKVLSGHDTDQQPDQRMQPKEVEICRLEFRYKDRYSEIVWCQAVKSTPQGDVVIFKGPEFVDVHAQAGKSLGHVLSSIFVSDRHDDELIQQRLRDLDNARSYAVSKLLADGWEPSAFDTQGHVTAMKRVRS